MIAAIDDEIPDLTTEIRNQTVEITTDVSKNTKTLPKKKFRDIATQYNKKKFRDASTQYKKKKFRDSSTSTQYNYSFKTDSSTQTIPTKFKSKEVQASLGKSKSL